MIKNVQILLVSGIPRRLGNKKIDMLIYKTVKCQILNKSPSKKPENKRLYFYILSSNLGI
jgi:hypothetical protein